MFWGSLGKGDEGESRTGGKQYRQVGSKNSGVRLSAVIKQTNAGLIREGERGENARGRFHKGQGRKVSKSKKNQHKQWTRQKGRLQKTGIKKKGVVR